MTTCRKVWEDHMRGVVKTSDPRYNDILNLHCEA
jgi:hypothetical protein